MIKKPSFGKVILGGILGIVLGLLMPLLLMMEAMSPVLLLPVLWSIGSSVWFGISATVVFHAAYLSMMYLCFGGAGFLAGSIAVFPLLLSILLGGKKQEAFFDQMQRGVMLSILSAAGAVLIAVAFFGSDLVGQAMDAIRAQMQTIPDELFSTIMTYSGVSAEDISVTDFRSLYDQILSILEENLNYHLPGRFLSGTALTAVLGVLWYNWLLARRGLASAESYIPLREWHLPKHITLGALALLVVTFLLVNTNQTMATTAFYAVYDLSCVAFGTQFAAALSRRLQKSRGKGRGFLITLAVLLPILFQFSYVLCLLGAISALFGSHGAFRKKKSDGNSQQQ